MKRLALYRDGLAPWAEVELATPLDRDALEDTGSRNEEGDYQGRKCERCNLSARVGVRTPCMDAVSFGGGGGLLVIGDAPTRDDDIAGVPFTSRSGKNIRRIVKQHWPGPVAFDYAVKCAPAATKLKDKQARECRGYLLSTIEAVRPTRIITLGPWAAFSVLGRSVPPMQSRRAYSWLRGGEQLGYGPIAVFMTLRPSDAERNRFVNGWLEEDMKHALTSPDPMPGPWDSHAHLIETEADALEAERDLMTNDWVTFDVETMGRMWNPEFVMMACSVNGDGDEEPWTWDEAALYNPKTRAPLERVLAASRVRKMGKVGSNVKYDQLAFRAAFGVRVHPIVGDTRLSRKLLDPEAGGALAAMGELVGMGGFKEDAKERMAAVKAAVKKRIRLQWRAKNPVPLVAGEPLVAGLDLHPAIDAAMRACSPTEVDDEADVYQYGMIPHDELAIYNARDAVATARVEHFVRERLPLEPSLERVWENIVLPGTVALERVECWGIAASMGAITSFDRLLTAKEQVIGSRLAVYPGVNWDSPDQVATLLFETLKLPIIKRTPGGKPSTDEEVLDLLKNKHPLCSDLLEWRSVAKLKGTYASGMIPHVRVDGRIHPNIKLDGARCSFLGTLILTDHGYIPVEDVRIGHKVIAHTGKPRAVTDAWQEPPVSIYRVRLANGLELRTTGNHPYRVGEDWVRADELHLGDAVAVHADPEEWRAVVDWPTYEVSSWGRVRRGKRVRIPGQRSTGHLHVVLSQRGVHKTRPIHQLVAAAFIGPRPKGHETRHLNGIPWDNTVRNLAYGTASDNRQDARRHGVLSQRRAGRTKLTQEQVDLIRATPRHEGVPSRAKLPADVLAAFAKRRTGKYGELTAFAREHGVSPQLVNMALKGRVPWHAEARSDLEFAVRFDVARETIKDIRRGKRWRDEDHVVGVAASFFEAKVVSIELLPPEVTFSLTVAIDESHVTAGIVTHNSGRTSCVAPGTLLRVPGGSCPVEAIRPGDIVWTHRERWRTVRAAWSNGVRRIFDVTLSNGNVLSCTSNHRVLASDGQWAFISELIREHLQGLGEQQGEPGERASAVSIALDADDRDYREADVDERAERSRGPEVGDAGSGAQSTRERSILAIEDRCAQPDEEQDGRSASKLEGLVRGRSRLPDDSAQRGTRVRSPGDGGGGAGVEVPAGSPRSSPHRFGPQEQHHGQPRAPYSEGAPGRALFAGEGLGGAHITGVDYRGSGEVYDLTVEEDESYETLGIFSHNCTSPNLQNIPRPDSAEGKMARDCFVAGRGKVLFEADYSQLELRIAAMLSGDPVMREIFTSGIDYHLRTAQMISRIAWGIPSEEVTDKHRSLAKSVNFGILYGKTARTLAEEWGVSTAKAQQVVDAIMGTFVVLDKWCKARRSEAEKTGLVWTWWKGQQARKRPLYRIAEKGNDGAMVTARNGAVNSPVQGTASEFCIASLIDSVDWIEGDGIEDDVKLVLAVHDSLLFEVNETMVDELAGQVNEIMLGHDSNGVPLVADFKAGPAWGSMKKYKLAGLA